MEEKTKLTIKRLALAVVGVLAGGYAGWRYGGARGSFLSARKPGGGEWLGAAGGLAAAYLLGQRLWKPASPNTLETTTLRDSQGNDMWETAKANSSQDFLALPPSLEVSPKSSYKRPTSLEVPDAELANDLGTYASNDELGSYSPSVDGDIDVELVMRDAGQR